MAHFEEKLSSREIFCGRIFSVTEDRVRLENGEESRREIVHHHGGVAVLALDEEGKVLLVRQFRYAFGQELLELPAGKVEPGEAPEVCGRRELEEECGYKAGSFELLSVLYPTVGYCSEVIHIYLARDLVPCGQRLDEGEFLSLERLPLEKALQMVLAGEVPDAKTQIGLLTYALRQQKA